MKTRSALSVSGSRASIIIAVMLLASSLLMVPAPNNKAVAQITASIPVGVEPTGIAFDPGNNRMYVANYASRSISVIEGTNVVATISVMGLQLPEYVAYNPFNNKIYSSGSGGVLIIDPNDNSVVASGIGSEFSQPAGIAFNPFNNDMYVAVYGSGRVLAINSLTNMIDANIPMNGAFTVAYNPAGNTIYVGQQVSAQVSVIDSITNTVTTTIALSGQAPYSMAFNPLNNKMYVSNADGNRVDIIDGSTNTITNTIATGGNQLRGIAFGPSDGRMYVIDRSPGAAYVIDGNTVVGGINLSVDVQYLDYNSQNNSMYVTDIGSNTVLVFPLPPPNSPPDCSSARPSHDSLVPPIVLWPPNHKMKDITVIVSDPDNDPVGISITSIRQDEPTTGQGNGDASPDGSGIGSSTAMVRVERSTSGDGRVYHIGFTASDGNGGSCDGHVQVSVPINQNDVSAGDQGAIFDSTAP